MIEATLDDSNGEVVEVPEGHLPAIGPNGMCFVPVQNYSCELIYKPPREKSNEKDQGQ